MKVFDIILLFLLIIVLGVASYFLYLNLPGEKVLLKPIYNGSDNEISHNNENATDGEYTRSKQFYENMRFPDRTISYNIDESCSEIKKNQAIAAFSSLESRTLLIFNNAENSANAQIKVLCSDISPEPEQEGHFVAGEGGPTKIINTSLYSVIFEGKLSLYRDEKCGTPHIALHEILHVLGFDHNNNPGSILYPTLDCSQKLDDYLAEKINELYRAPSLPDLRILDVQATKSGRYLNFDIKVINQGLKDTENVVLEVYADGEFASRFELDALEVGTTKTLNVENSRLPSRNSKEITFFVDKENRIQELNENNNEVQLAVE